MGKLFEELKRRKVFRVAAVYAVVAWVLIQVSDVVLPTFGTPSWVNQTIIFLFILGFLPTLIAAWAYEVTPDGIRPDFQSRSQEHLAPSSDRKLIYATFFLVLVAVGFQVADRIYFSERQAATRSVAADPPLANTSTFQGLIELDHPLRSPPRTSSSPQNLQLPRTFLSLTADGSNLIYTSYQSDDTHQLLIRNLTTQETRVLYEGDLITSQPQISPDGKRVSINTTTELMIGNIGSRVVQPVNVDNLHAHSVGWLSDDEIIYTEVGAILHRKSLLDDSDSSFGDEVNGMSPWVLSGGNAFLFSTSTRARLNANLADIKIHELGSGNTKTLISNGYEPRFASSGHVTFIRNGNLWAVPFNPENLEITGTEVQVVSGVHSQPALYSASYTFSQLGRLIYLAGEDNQATVNWLRVDRLGTSENIPLMPGVYRDPELSPDRRSLAIIKIEGDGTRDIWVHDIVNSTMGRKTFTGNVHNPIWSPDGSRLFYQAGFVEEPSSIWSINSDGPGNPQIVYAETGKTLSPVSFTNDGEQLLYLEGLTGSRTLNVLTLRNDTWMSSPLAINPQFNTLTATVSPNGRWIAYDSNQNGKYDVYVSSYPRLDTPRQITMQSGQEPKWGPNGDELFYLGEDQSLMSAKVNTESDFSWEAPVPLLSGFSANGINTPNYAVSADGQLFIRQQIVFEGELAADEATPATLTIFEDWFEELKRLAPPDP